MKNILYWLRKFFANGIVYAIAMLVNFGLACAVLCSGLYGHNFVRICFGCLQAVSIVFAFAHLLVMLHPLGDSDDA